MPFSLGKGEKESFFPLKKGKDLNVSATMRRLLTEEASPPWLDQSRLP